MTEMFQWKKSSVGWERVPTLFCTSNVTWRFRYFISISTCSAWNSI